MEIHIPPLKDRPEDIPLLIDYFIQRHNPELKRNFDGIDADAVQLLMALPWKGNVRELDNVIEHTMILAEGERITVRDLPAAVVASSAGQPAFTFNLKDAVNQFRKSISPACSIKLTRIARKRRNCGHQPLLALPQDRRSGIPYSQFQGRAILLNLGRVRESKIFRVKPVGSFPLFCGPVLAF